MGIDVKTFKWLKPHLSGRILTLGRQHWCDGSDLSERQFFDEIVPNVDSVDVSHDDQPTFIADLNEPLPEWTRNRYDCVIDSGTLEHVFNVPVALESVRRALKINGIFLSAGQILNLTGHGFWSFSPEVLWRWSEANGFTNQQCYVRRIGPCSLLRKITVQARRRLELTSVVPLSMYFRATKSEDRVGIPQQAGPCMDRPIKFWSWTSRLFRHQPQFT